MTPRDWLWWIIGFISGILLAVGMPQTVTNPLALVSPANVQTPMSTPVAAGSPFGCNGVDDLNCSDFAAIGQSADAHLAACGDEDKLDRDGDGHACEVR